MIPRLTWNFQVNTVAVIFIAAVCVNHSFGAATVKGLSRGDQFVAVDTNANMFLLPVDVVCRGHAGSICLTLISCLLTVCAVTTQSCKNKRTETKGKKQEKSLKYYMNLKIMSFFYKARSI